MDMKFFEINPPRRFQVQRAGIIEELSDWGRIELQAGELVTFVTPNGAEYDVARKSWGFYATPSMNTRLRSHGFRAALVINMKGQLFLMLVEHGKEEVFLDYLRNDHQRLLSWLDTDKSVARIERLLMETDSHD
jgi:hypothetical protein